MPPYSFGAGDEVGQVGFKFERGSTEFFILTLVLTNEPQFVRDELDRLRSRLRLPAKTEFKFHSTPRSLRVAFLEEGKTWPLVARSLCVNKRLLPMDFRRLKSWEFYSFFMARLLDR